MRVQIKKMTTKIAAALFLAAAIMSVGTKEARADEMDTQPAECVETVVEGQGDVIDDQFAVVEGQGDIIDDCFAVAPEEAQPATETEVEGQGDVIDDQFAVVEGQGDIIDDEFAVAPEAEEQPVVETVVDPFAGMIKINSAEDLYRVMTEHRPFNPIKDGVIDPLSLLPVEGQGDVIDDEFAYVEGQGDVIDDEFAYVEGQGDVIDDQFAVTPEAAVEAVEVAENDTEVVAPSVKSFVAVGSADEAQKAEETKKDDDDLVFTFNPFNPIVPVRAVPSRNQSEKKSDALETVQTINKFINPSDSVYGNPIRELIDDSDVLGDDEKEYLKNSTSLMIGADEGMACADFLPLWGSVKKVGKMSESLVKLHDSKTTADKFNNTIDVVQNLAESVVCAIPGGGLALNAYKAQMEVGSYCFKKVCRFVNWLF